MAFSGTLSANGAAAGSGGAGGSILLVGDHVQVSSASAAGGDAYADGSVGRIAVYYADSYDPGTWEPGYLEDTKPAVTPSPTPTPLTQPCRPMPTGWAMVA